MGVMQYMTSEGDPITWVVEYGGLTWLRHHKLAYFRDLVIHPNMWVAVDDEYAWHGDLLRDRMSCDSVDVDVVLPHELWPTFDDLVQLADTSYSLLREHVIAGTARRKFS